MRTEICCSVHVLYNSLLLKSIVASYGLEEFFVFSFAALRRLGFCLHYCLCCFVVVKCFFWGLIKRELKIEFCFDGFFALYNTIHSLSVQHPSSSSSPSSSWPVDTIQSHNNTLRNFYNISNMVFCFSFVFVVVYPCAFEMTISVANNMYTNLKSDAVLKRYKTFRARTLYLHVS